jgi:hypothetical protein
MNEALMAKSAFWKKMGIGATIVALVAAGFAAFSFHKSVVYAEQAVDVQSVIDSTDSQIKTAPKGAAAATEHGAWALQVVRDGKVIAEETAQNFLADEGESDLLACFYRGTSCPTSFTWALLSTSATPAENSTWSSISASELVVGTSAGYEAATKTLSRDATGWSTLDTVASGTGGCTETVCARVSTAQQTITASGNWTVGARYIVIRTTTTNRLIAVAQLSADRTLQSGDQLNLTYRQAMQ